EKISQRGRAECPISGARADGHTPSPLGTLHPVLYSRTGGSFPVRPSAPRSGPGAGAVRRQPAQRALYRLSLWFNWTGTISSWHLRAHVSGGAWPGAWSWRRYDSTLRGHPLPPAGDCKVSLQLARLLFD